jgi:hypothetical protein
VNGWIVHDCWELSSMMIWILVKPDAFVEDREEAAREFGQKYEVSMKNTGPASDGDEDFGDDGDEDES